MENDSPVLCWTRQEELLVRIASYVQDTKTLSIVSRCSRYCYEMLLPRRCKTIDVFIIDTVSLLLFVKRHVDATYQCRSLEVIGKADIDNDPRSKASHNALKGILAHIANCSSRLVNFSYTTPWNEPFFVPNDIWLELSTSKHLEALDSTILLDRQPALCAFTFHRLWKLRLAVSVTDTLQRDWDAATAGDQMFLSFLQRHSGLEALLLIYESPATIINMSSLDLPDLDLFSLDLRGYDTSRISHQLLFQPIFVNNHPNLRSIALPVQKTG